MCIRDRNIPVTRSFGFTCGQGLIYSDWLPSLSQNVQVSYIKEDISYALQEQARYAVIGESGCADTVLVDVLPFDGIEMQIPEGTVEASLGDTISLPFINYLANDVTWHVFYNERELVFEESPTQLSFNVVGNGEYAILAINEFGCFFRENVQIDIPDLSSIVYIANSISPNGDNINDDIIAYNRFSEPIELIDFKLYNRWGNPVARSEMLTIEESLTIVDGDELNDLGLQTGVYIYVLKLNVEGQDINISGDITVF